MTGNDPDAMWFEQRNIAALLAGMQEGAVLMDAGSSIVAANKAAKELLGLGIEQMTGRSSLDPLWQSLHADGSPWPGTDHPSVRCLRTGEPQMNQIMGVQSSGTLRWLKVNAIPIDGQDERDDAAPGIDVLDMVGRDVTDREVAQQALRQAEHRFRLTFDMGPTAKAIVLPDGRFMRVNAVMAHLVQADAHEMLGRSWADFVLEDDRDEFQAFLDDTMATDQGSKSCLVRLRRRDGQMLHASVWASAVHQADGRPVYLIAHTEDVTAQKQTQDALA